MKYFTIILMASLFAVSCQKSFNIEEHNVEALNAKTLPEPDIEIQKDTFYKPVFWNSRFLYSEFKVRNRTGQTLEKIVFSPSLEISYKNELDHNVPLAKDSILENLNSGGSVNYEKLYSLGILNDFKEKILLHKAKKAILKIEIEGTNSIGYNTAKENPFSYEKDITEEWNFLHSFSRDGNFREAIEVYFNYSDQLNSSIATFKNLDENFLNIINKEFIGESNFSYPHIENSKRKIKNITLHQNLLYSEFYKDLGRTIRLSPSLKSNWKIFNDSKINMALAREEIISQWEVLQKFEDSLKELHPNPTPGYHIRVDGEWTRNPEYEILKSDWEEKRDRLFEALAPARDSLYQGMLTSQENLIRQKEKAIEYYEKFQEEMVEELKMEEFVDSYLEKHRIF